MAEKERGELIVKAVAVQKCIDSIDMHHEWIQHTAKKWDSLNNIKSYWITISGYTEEEGDTDVDIPLSIEEEVIELIKEKLKKEIQGHKKSISNEYEKLNNLLK